MSSIEAMISEMEEDYDKILKNFEKNVDSSEGYYRFKQVSESEILRLLRDVMKFQRKLEYFLRSLESLVKKNDICGKSEGDCK